jgi:hypothetical protein
MRKTEMGFRRETNAGHDGCYRSELKVPSGKRKIMIGEAAAIEPNKQGIVHCLSCKEPVVSPDINLDGQFRIIFTPIPPLRDR